MSALRRVSANACANLAIRGTRYPIEDLGRVYRGKGLRRALLADHGLPIRHGAMLE